MLASSACQWTPMPSPPQKLPNEMSIWPNFKSPLIWDVFAVSTYLTVSVLFWYLGLLPDLASLRDRAVRRAGRAVRLEAAIRIVELRGRRRGDAAVLQRQGAHDRAVHLVVLSVEGRDAGGPGLLEDLDALVESVVG